LPFRGLRFLDGEDAVEAELPAQGGWGVRRTVLHRHLVEAAEAAGAVLWWQTPVVSIARHGVVAGGEEIRARWIIGADGGQSRMRMWSGLDRGERCSSRYALRRHFQTAPWSSYVEVYWGVKAQAFVTPTGVQEVCVATTAEDAARSFEEILDEFPVLRGNLAGCPSTDALRGSVTSTRSLPRVTVGNIALVGDASGGVDAITGEGLGLSFRQALLLANAISAGDLRIYERAHRRCMRAPRVMARLLLAISRHENLRRRAFRAFASDAELFRRLLAYQDGAASPLRSARTGFHLGWRLLRA
jgi:flavin-dependent dehydrogenase